MHESEPEDFGCFWLLARGVRFFWGEFHIIQGDVLATPQLPVNFEIVAMPRISKSYGREYKRLAAEAV